MEKKKRPFLGESSWTSSPPEGEPERETKSPHWTKSPPAHVQVTDHLDTLTKRALIPQKLLEDRVGLARAYDSPNNVYIRGNTAYVAGTQLNRNSGEAMGDLFDDAKLPFGGITTTRRYEQLQQALARRPEVTNLVGHSLGGASVLEAEKAESVTYNYNVWGSSDGCICTIFAAVCPQSLRKLWRPDCYV
jgi:hypothetical protein